MMFVSGETAEPTGDSIALVELIIQQQVKELLRRSIDLSHRAGSRNISPDELLFLYRHDKAKVSRLLHFLQWKDVRKNVQDGDERGGADVDLAAGGEEALGAVGAGAAGPNAAIDPKKTTKKAKVMLPWDASSFYNQVVPARDDEDDEEEREMNSATLQRLKYADERTRNMSREAYM